MGVLTRETRGRPFYVADIPFTNDAKVQLLQDFYAAVATFKYRETMAVARQLGVHERTVYRWKYHESFPRYDIALDIIEWVRRGKPMTLQYQRQRHRDLM